MISSTGLPSRLTDPQQAAPAALCEVCQGELYAEDLFYLIGGAAVCEDCLGAFAEDYFAALRIQGRELTDKS